MSSARRAPEAASPRAANLALLQKYHSRLIRRFLSASVLDLFVDIPRAVRDHWLRLSVDLEREVLVLENIRLV
eukprot:9453524-Pyramimonas_sp.AAC.1